MAQGNATNPTQALRTAVRQPPALDPERPGLVQPWREFVSRGWVTQITSEFTPTGLTMKVSVGKDVGGGATGIPPGQAKEMIVKAGLWSPKGKKSESDKKKEPARPKKSLCKSDFEDGPEKVKERALAIAKALGSTVAKGRIGSLKLMISGCDTFEKWWRVADGNAKLKLFADAKHISTFPANPGPGFGKLMNGDCPFRGSVPTPAETAEAESDAGQTEA